MNQMSSNTGRNLRGNLSGGDIIPKGYKKGQLAQFTPEQMQLFQSMFGQLGPNSQLAGLARGDEGAFSQMEAPAYRQFSENLGGLSAQFSRGSGGQSLGLGGSSGFRNAQTSAASNFAQDLASRRQELSSQALRDLFNMSNSLLGQRPYDTGLFQKPQKQGNSFGDLFSGIGGAAGSAFGGPFGGALGNSGANFLSKIFGLSG